MFFHNAPFASKNSFVDYKSGRGPDLIKMFEGKEHVYYIFTEPALETITLFEPESKVYSRVARVCKNDRGRGNFSDVSKFLFATLYKTRLLCGNPGAAELSYRFVSDEFVGYYANYVDEVGKKY